MREFNARDNCQCAMTQFGKAMMDEVEFSYCTYGFVEDNKWVSCGAALLSGTELVGYIELSRREVDEVIRSENFSQILERIKS